jgi:protein-S-isoprenylcysteine O-methyltransferase Ste14
MKRVGFLLFGLLAYAIFLFTFLYLMAFVAGLPQVPRSIDYPVSAMPVPAAVLVNLALLALFGVQHSVMARQSFKAVWTRLVPKPIERSFYLIFTCLALILIFLFWQPLPAMLWEVRGGIGEPLLWTICAIGWVIVFLSTFLISHFELFGLKQVWSHWRATPAVAPQFRQPFFYRLVRHPLYSGFLITFWATPTMSYGHLLFAAAMTGYILIAIEFEERDLVALFGRDYETYRKKVGKLTPRLR